MPNSAGRFNMKSPEIVTYVQVCVFDLHVRSEQTFLSSVPAWI